MTVRRLSLIVLAASMFAPSFEPGRPSTFVHSGPAHAAEAPAEGFGGIAQGGQGQPVYRVTSLGDSGPGTLRDAVSRSNRHVVFDVAGEVVLSSDVKVQGAYITIDGFTAPSPGITVKNFGIHVSGPTVHDIVIRGIRVRNSGQMSCEDPTCSPQAGLGLGILVTWGAHRVVIDHVSVAHSGNAAVSVVKGGRDVTISDSIVLENNNLISATYNLPMLISGNDKAANGERTRRVTLVRNLIMNGNERMPQVKWSNTGEQAPEVMVDVINNVIWGWKLTGTTIWRGAKANVTRNYFHAPGTGTSTQQKAIAFCETGSVAPQCDPVKYPDWVARAYIAENVSGAGAAMSAYLNNLGTESAPFPAAPVRTIDACTAAWQVLQGAGAQPHDAIDAAYVAKVVLTNCPKTPPPPVPPAPQPPGPVTPPPAVSPPSAALVTAALLAPSTVQPGTAFSVKFNIANRGTGASGASQVKIYLSPDNRMSSDDVVLGTQPIATIAPGASYWYVSTASVPARVSAGSYYMRLVLDASTMATAVSVVPRPATSQWPATPPAAPPAAPSAEATLRARVEALYRTLLLREPDAAGVTSWVDAVRSGLLTEAAVAQAIRGSPEGRATHLVLARYRQILLREPDPGGFLAWKDAIVSGRISLDQTWRAFNDSWEGQVTRHVVTMYRQILGREPDAGGLATWKHAIVSGLLTPDQAWHAMVQARAAGAR